MVHQEFEHREKTTKQQQNKSKDHIKLTTNGNMIEDVQQQTLFWEQDFECQAWDLRTDLGLGSLESILS